MLTELNIYGYEAQRRRQGRQSVTPKAENARSRLRRAI